MPVSREYGSFALEGNRPWYHMKYAPTYPDLHNPMMRLGATPRLVVQRLYHDVPMPRNLTRNVHLGDQTGALLELPAPSLRL